MDKKVELRTKMAQLHREYADTATQLKEIEESEKKAALKQKFKEYTYKVFIGKSFPSEPIFLEVTDEDREYARISDNTGVAFCDLFKDGSCVLVRNKEEYSRAKTLYDRIMACNALQDQNELDKQKYVKILLGEVDAP